MGRLVGKASFAFAQFGVEAGTLDGDTNLLAERGHELEIGLVEGRADALDIEEASGLAGVVEGDADLGGDAIDGTEEVGVGGDVGDEERLAAGHGAARDASGDGNAGQYAVVANLMLEKVHLAGARIETDLGKTEGGGDRLNDNAIDGGGIEFAGEAGAHAVEEGEITRLAFGGDPESAGAEFAGAKFVLGAGAGGDVHGDVERADEFAVATEWCVLALPDTAIDLTDGMEFVAVEGAVEVGLDVGAGLLDGEDGLADAVARSLTDQAEALSFAEEVGAVGGDDADDDGELGDNVGEVEVAQDARRAGAGGEALGEGGDQFCGVDHSDIFAERAGAIGLATNGSHF